MYQFTARLGLVCGLLLALTQFTFAADAEVKERCPVCGMFTKEKSPTSFVVTHHGQPAHFCSFSCAVAFHRKSPEVPMTAFAYGTGTPVDAEKAFYLIKSGKLAEEFKFAMPPVVVAFASRAEAEKAKERVKEGEILEGFSAVQKVYQK